MRVVRTGRGFRMILHTEKRKRAMAHAFIGVIVQVDVGEYHLAGRQGIGSDNEAVVWGSDLDVPSAHVFYRVIRAMMAEFQLVGAATQSETAKLVAQANAEYG